MIYQIKGNKNSKTLSLGSLCLQSSRSFDQPAMFDWELKSTVGGGAGKGE